MKKLIRFFLRKFGYIHKSEIGYKAKPIKPLEDKRQLKIFPHLDELEHNSDHQKL